MEEAKDKDVETQADASNNEDQDRILNLCKIRTHGQRQNSIDIAMLRLTLYFDEALDRRKDKTDSKSQEEDSIEEGTKKLGTLPTKAQCLRRAIAFGDLYESNIALLRVNEGARYGNQGNDEAD
ncbi:hypothetical protein SLS59_009386 [Nothophoma quercina]|uniref:Uncharacterized protein n=1 Tax=Nothophoma quercina TaxID=749835 RepID=A0ABR3QLN4_9PLEO